jgi:hypothetical protein
MNSSSLTLKELAIKELQKYQINGFNLFDTKKQYFLITKEGLHIDLGYFMKYKNESIFDHCCWYDGPTYSKVQWHFEFSGLDDDLRQELNLIECVDFYKKYVGFYEYPNNYEYPNRI